MIGKDFNSIIDFESILGHGPSRTKDMATAKKPEKESILKSAASMANCESISWSHNDAVDLHLNIHSIIPVVSERVAGR